MMRPVLMLGLVLAAAGCYQSYSAHEVSLTGRVDRATFPYDVGSVRVVKPYRSQDVPLAADGSFVVEPQRGFENGIRFVSANDPSRTALLVYPKSGGQFDLSKRFGLSNLPSDLGVIRFVGRVPAGGLYTQTLGFAVDQAAGGGDCGDGEHEHEHDGEEAGDDGDGHDHGDHADGHDDEADGHDGEADGHDDEADGHDDDAAEGDGAGDDEDMCVAEHEPSDDCGDDEGDDEDDD